MVKIIELPRSIAVIGAGVSGLTSAVVLAEQGERTVILADESGTGTTSGAAAAIWYPYDTGPTQMAIAWALVTYGILLKLSKDPASGVSFLEMRKFSRHRDIEIPKWARMLHTRELRSEIPNAFRSGLSMNVPLMDTTTYLDYLLERFRKAGGELHRGKHFTKLEEVDSQFDLIVNCTGIGARGLAQDSALEPHRGQVVIVPKLKLSGAIACDDAPLTYAIPRKNDCVFGGTNDLSQDCTIDPIATEKIVTDCSAILGIKRPKVLAEKVGLRPFRRSGVRLEETRIRDGRPVIHNYGHGGAGFTLSWGCAEDVGRLASPEKEHPPN